METILAKLNTEMDWDTKESVAMYLHSLKTCRMFASLEAWFEKPTATEIRKIGRNAREYCLNAGEIYVVLKDGVTEIVNITGSSGFGAIRDVHKAVERLYDIAEKPMEIEKPRPISWDRLSELATMFKDGLELDDKESALKYFEDICEMSPSEMEYFGIEYKRYKVVEVELRQTRFVKVKVAIPQDEYEGNAVDYIDINDIDGYYDGEITDYGWEETDRELLSDDLTANEVSRRNDIYNEDTFADD